MMIMIPLLLYSCCCCCIVMITTMITIPIHAYTIGLHHTLQSSLSFSSSSLRRRKSLSSSSLYHTTNHETYRFQLSATTSTTTTASTSTSTINSDKIKKVGCGISIVPSGNCLLFDPNQEGKLSNTNNVHDRILFGTQYIHHQSSKTSTTTSSSKTTSNHPITLMDTQHWLEDIGIPLNVVKSTQPVLATVLGRASLIDQTTAPGDIQHIILQLPNNSFHYVEGQSLSVIPPGIDPINQKPYKPRLYSIASTRYGDLLDGTTVSLCVRRAEYIDPITGIVDPTKMGVCSNFLCNSQPGDTIQVAGPVGKTMLLPNDLSKDIIMVATGTGIAPFRGFLHRLFMEQTVARHMYTGHAWLILGVPVSGGLLYTNEITIMQQNAIPPSQFEVSYAISREMKNKQGNKLYVQDILRDRADEIFQKLDHGAVIYFCGLKGMMPGILDALQDVAQNKYHIDWTKRLEELKKNHQWHVEVY